MYVVVLAGSHERGINSAGTEVPYPLLDLYQEPYLTTLVRKVSGLPHLQGVVVVTNDAIGPEIDEWAAALPSGLPRVLAISDGTRTPEDRLGAIGDLRYALEAAGVDTDVLVLGGDNWFTYDLQDFVRQVQDRTPAVLVTPFRPSWRCSRFGLVRVTPAGRVVEFLEKPDRTEAHWRASCVYYFGARDLKWLDEFAESESTECSPGTFFAWLVDRTPVYAMQTEGTWYDIGGSSPTAAKGPDFLAIRDMVRHLASPAFSTWERSAARELQWVTSHEQLQAVLDDEDPNRRIIAAMLLGHAAWLLSEEGQADVIRSLLERLADPGFNQYEYASHQEDEDTIVYVSVTVAESLVRIGYADSVQGVFRRASEEGHPTGEHGAAE